MSTGLRIAVISHGHPDFSVGGAEVAAYNLFNGYRQNPDVEKAVFLARFDRNAHPSGTIMPRREDEYLWDHAMHDWHLFRGTNRKMALHRFAEWLQSVRPHVIHAHHYAHMGLEMFRVAKEVCPDVKLFLTIHEYMAICKHNGQMVKRGTKRLCNRESIDDCQRCYPELSREDFWLRKRFIMRHFDLIDGFISPSEFLRQRYIEWGLSPERITVIENGQVERTPVPHRTIKEGDPRNRFGFFGQINEFKGVDLLLQAFDLARKQTEVPLFLEVHGANLEQQTETFQARINELRQKLERKGVLKWMGSYEPEQLQERMANVDWVVLPSIWWENSPMVIQEAFSNQRPLIVSDIGGLAEKVRNGIDGFHVSVGNVYSWAATLQRLATNSGEWNRLKDCIKAPKSCVQIAALHVGTFNEIFR